MANNISVLYDPQGVDWPLGFVDVSNIGTPVNIMVNVDPNNNNAPGTRHGEGVPVAQYTPRCHKIFFQGYKPGNNNNGMTPNSDNVYILRSFGPSNNATAGGPGNRSDSGMMVQVLPPGGSATLPADEIDTDTISPYRYTIDANNNGDGALVTLIGCGR